ncbi:hypothetical protein [Bacillus cereus group sp. BfR-BA-01383]|uniref:hypothetical protein n=1 Tax=Bacillus cereus group sp. BfR-BA-01383 TaxID=2920327 RepID=UPI001F5ABF1D|nr:hypothetical protein [Bacillus cereus group sp. BfR-BA-01383]
MFWLGCFVGYVVGSFITCGVLYFCFRAEENKKAELHKRNLEESVKKEMEQLSRLRASSDD